jgi:hypothetical protein
MMATYINISSYELVIERSFLYVQVAWMLLYSHITSIALIKCKFVHVLVSELS